MEQPQLHIFFFPFMAPGHMIPLLDMAKLFSSSTIKSTIITTPLNSATFSNSIPSKINIQILDFPAAAAQLPAGIENLDQCTSGELIFDFVKSTVLFQEPLEKLLAEFQPDCLVADNLYPWATGSAAKFNIPRLVFYATSLFATCASASMSMYKPFKYVASDSEPFVLPNLPHQIMLTRSEIAEDEREETVNDFTKLLMSGIEEADSESYGIIFNSFLELEPDYFNHYKNVLKRKAWSLGPFSLLNKEIQEKTMRGKKPNIDEHQCLKWLDSQKPNSVIYISFGSLAKITTCQLYEIAKALEASDQHFIWVVKEYKTTHNMWLPQGFEERMIGTKGLIIRGWAPQVLILDHEAVGGFVTHCGWNSTLEAICGGVAMVTWPLFAEQFYNEKLVNEVLRIGVGVGAKEWSMEEISGVIKSDVVEKAMKMVMGEEEGEEMRRRAKKLKEKAKEAVEKGGSSYSDLMDLIENLSSLKLNARPLN